MTTTWKAPSDTALIIIDQQVDFCEGGNLAVNGGNGITKAINRLKDYFNLVVLTQDFHPAGHKSFASAHAGKNPFELTQMPYGPQVLWPDHCVQGTKGVEFHPDLNVSANDLVLQKGTNPDVDSYSAFYENDKKSQPRFDNGKTLTETLKENGISRVVLTGLAFDYCVGYSALDAASEGFEVIVVEDASAAIAEDSTNAMREAFKNAGVKLVKAADLPSVLGNAAPSVPAP